MTRLLQIARAACDLDLADAPLDVRERLRLQSLSVLAATAAGADAVDVAPVLAVAAERPGPYRVVPGAPATDLDTALRLGAAMSVAHDWDDYLLCGHTGHTAHWASWLGGASLERDWDEVERAQLAANEVMGRLGGLCLAGPSNGQGWAFLHAAGGALVGGLLRRLAPEQVAHAMAIALSSAPIVSWRTFHSGAKVLVAGEALAAGWRAAALAEAGLEGPLDVLDDGSDLLEPLAGGRPLPRWLSGIGQTWLTRTMTFKAVPGCAYVATAVEALSELLDEIEEAEGRRITADDVLRIDVDAGLLTCAMELLLGGPQAADPPRLEPVGVNFSVARSLALLLARGSLGPDDLTLQALAESASLTADLEHRVHVHHDWRMTLDTWERLRSGMRIDALLQGLGPTALVARAAKARRAGAGRGRDGVHASGPPGLGTGMAWSELPLALVSERLDELMHLDGPPADLLSGGVDRLSRSAGRWMRRRLGGLLGVQAGPDLADIDLMGVALPVPARVRLLEHGGRVWEAERLYPNGSPAATPHEVRSMVRAKLLRAAPGAIGFADRLVTLDGDLPQHAGGPAALLATWATG